MKHHFVFLLVALALVTTACGDDLGSTASTTPPPPIPTTRPAASPTTGATTSVAASPDSAQPSDGTPTVAFDGESCTYTGPTEFEVNTLPAFVARNTGTVDYNFVMLQIDATLDYQDVFALVDGFRGLGPDLPAGISERSGSGIIGSGEEQRFNAAFTASGNYLPACETFPDPVWFVTERFVTVP